MFHRVANGCADLEPNIRAVRRHPLNGEICGDLTKGCKQKLGERSPVHHRINPAQTLIQFERIRDTIIPTSIAIDRAEFRLQIVQQRRFGRGMATGTLNRLSRRL